ncbi:MAG: SAM-dependent methyltransferase [Bacteroidetes bacterium]|nr:MAG: SAM-dependent methyltransferase [Bacteroidota bacterium]
MATKKSYSEGWDDYELIDAGGGKKLERWGNVITIRPEVQAYFQSAKPFSEWYELANWEFIPTGQSGKWKCLKKGSPNRWTIRYKKLSFILELTKFKHIGLFPEQRINWDLIDNKLNESHRFLNLFAYTGAASCVARYTGAETFHVDSVKQLISWARENMEASRILNIKWVHEDALKFAQREVKRGNHYKGIIMDPPAWGIGAKGEKWKLEEKIDELMATANELLEEDGFLIMNTYSPALEQSMILDLASMYFEGRKIELTGLWMKTTTGRELYYGDLLRINC